MRLRLIDVLNSIFSICIIIAIAGGVITFILFVGAIAVGSEELAVKTWTVYLPYFIKAASLAIAIGLLAMYISKSHFLSLDTEQNRTKNK